MFLYLMTVFTTDNLQKGKKKRKTKFKIESGPLFTDSVFLVCLIVRVFYKMIELKRLGIHFH